MEPVTSIDATIAAAIQARVEASVIQALSGDQVLGQYVAAALNQPLTLERNYKKIETTFLKHTINLALQGAIKAAINAFLVDEVELINDEIRKALRRNVTNIAEQMTHALATRAGTTYGMSIDLKFPDHSS